MRVAAGLLLSGALLVAVATAGVGGSAAIAAGVFLLVVGAVVGAASLEANDHLSSLATGLDELEALATPAPTDQAVRRT